MYIGIPLVYMFHALSAFLLCRSRYGRKKTALICIGTVLLQTAILFLLPSPDRSDKWAYPLFVLSFCFTLVLYFVLSKETISQTLFVLMTYTQVFLVAMFLSVMISRYFFHSDGDAIMWVRTALHFGILMGYVCFFQKKVDETRRELTGGWWPMCLMSVLYMICISYVSMKAQVSFGAEMDVSLFLLVLAAMVTGYAVVFRTIRYMYEVAMNSRIEEYEKILEQKLEIMQEAEEETKRLRHDLRHHMINIAEFARNGENEKLLKYLGEYSSEVEKTGSKHLCANPVIDNVLMAYDRRARQHGITTFYETSKIGEVAMEDVDLVAILANLMENAINGCLESGKEQMYIKTRIQTKAGKLSIWMENTCKDGAVDGEEPLQSGAREGFGKKGIGISSILKSVDSYGGYADFKYEAGIFTSRVIFSGGGGKINRREKKAFREMGCID